MNAVGVESPRHFDIFENGVNLRESLLLLVLGDQLLLHAGGIGLQVFRQAAFDAGFGFDEDQFFQGTYLIYSLNAPFFHVVAILTLHLVGRQGFCCVLRNRMGPVQDCLLGLLVEHLQLLWIPGGQRLCITIKDDQKNLLLRHAVIADIELPLHKKNFILFHSVLHQGLVVVQPIH